MRHLFQLTLSLHSILAALFVVGGVFALVEAVVFALELVYLRSAPRPPYDRTTLPAAQLASSGAAIEGLDLIP